MNEAARLVEEGAAIEAVDKAMVAFGFPVGPITLLDEVGIDVGAKVAKVMHHALRRAHGPAGLDGEGARGRPARAARTSAGFYTYDGKKKRVDESVYALLPAGPARRPFEARGDPGAARLRVPERGRAVPGGRASCARRATATWGRSSAWGSRRSWAGPSATSTTCGARFAVQVLEKLAAPARRAVPARPGPAGPGPRGLELPRTDERLSSGTRRDHDKNGKILHPPARLPGPHVVMQRFRPILGKRRTEENLPLLTLAHAAYMGLRRSAKAIRGRGANIFTQWVGDPDALGSAILLEAILTELGAREVRILTGSLGHPAEPQPGRKVGLVLHDPNKERLPRGLHCMVDTSPPLGMASTGGVQPVKEYFFVADHHADPADVEETSRIRGVKRVKLAFVGLPVGSTSAFMAVIAAAFDLLDKLGPAGRAAAALGIYTDTSALLHGATAPRLQDVRAAHPRRGHPGPAGRAARLPGASRVVHLPRRGLPQPGGEGGGAGGPHRLRAREPPRRDRGDRERAAADRGDVDRHRDRGDRAGDRGLGARGQPAARAGPAAHRAG